MKVQNENVSGGGTENFEEQRAHHDLEVGNEVKGGTEMKNTIRM